MICREKNIITLICDGCGETFQVVADQDEKLPIHRVEWKDLCSDCYEKYKGGIYDR